MNMENEIRLQKNTKFQQKFHQMYFLENRKHSLTFVVSLLFKHNSSNPQQ